MGSKLKEWKTTLIGLITYGVAFYYLLEVAHAQLFKKNYYDTKNKQRRKRSETASTTIRYK